MTADSHPNRRNPDLLSVERLVGLSDNVVAFALSLPVLHVTVPPLSQVADPASAADLAAQLTKQGRSTAGSSATRSAAGTAWPGGTSRS